MERKVGPRVAGAWYKFEKGRRLARAGKGEGNQGGGRRDGGRETEKRKGPKEEAREEDRI